MAGKSVYVADVYRPGLADPKTFAFLDRVERDAFVDSAKATKWYRVEAYQIALHDSAEPALRERKEAFGV